LPASNSSQPQISISRRPHASYSSFKSSEPSLHSPWLNLFHQVPFSSWPVNLPDGYVFLAPDGRLHQCVNRCSYPLNRAVDGRPLFITQPINWPFPVVDPLSAFDMSAQDGFTGYDTNANLTNDGDVSALQRLRLSDNSEDGSFGLDIVPPPVDDSGLRHIDAELSHIERVKSYHHELFKQVEKKIVHADAVTKQKLVDRKIELTNFLDKCRKTQKQLTQRKEDGVTAVVPTDFIVQVFHLNTPNQIDPKSNEASPTQPVDAITNSSNPRRRSHAVEIRAPAESSNAPTSSNLNPASPAYEPLQPVSSRGSQPISPFVPPSPSAPPSPMVLTPHQRGQLPSHLQEASSSSATTSDFFPNRTEQYSLRRNGQEQEAPASTAERVNPLDWFSDRYPTPPPTPRLLAVLPAFTTTESERRERRGRNGWSSARTRDPTPHPRGEGERRARRITRDDDDHISDLDLDEDGEDRA
jgi:hypothetical protein